MATGIPRERMILKKENRGSISDLVASSGFDLDVQILEVLCILFCKSEQLPLTQVHVIGVLRVLPVDKPLSGTLEFIADLSNLRQATR